MSEKKGTLPFSREGEKGSVPFFREPLVHFLVLGTALIVAFALFGNRTGGAVVLGLVHGSLNGGSLATTSAGITGVLGVACTIFVVAALIAGAVVSLHRSWARIVVRVAGSWIAAIGLLMLGWSVRKGLP